MNGMDINLVDIGVVAVIVLSAIFAFARGFVREALSIVAWVGAAAITFYAFGRIDALVDARVHTPLLSHIIAGVGLFVGSLIVLTIVTGFIGRLVRIAALSPIDRTLGFIFGLARGAFLVCLAYLLLDVAVPQAEHRPDVIRQAKSVLFLQRYDDWLRTLVPPELRERATNAADGLLYSPDPKADADAQAKKAMRVDPAAPAAAVGPTTPMYNPAKRRGMDSQINRVGGQDGNVSRSSDKAR